MTDTHALNRTSPKGGPFIGTCFKCGTTDLPMTAVSWPCENVANLSQGEALLLAIDPAPVDTNPTGGDNSLAPFIGSAAGEAGAPVPDTPNPVDDGREGVA